MPPPSKIATLPDDLRAWLRKAIVERGFGGIEGLTAELNALCKEGGVAITVGKSAVGKESQRIKRAQEAIHATTEAARLIAETSPDEADNRSAAAMAIVQSEVFELLLRIREADDMDDVARLDVMNDAALGLSRMSRSRVNQSQWAIKLDDRAKQVADKVVAKISKQGGVDAKTVAEIRRSILGIVKRDTPAPPAPA